MPEQKGLMAAAWGVGDGSALIAQDVDSTSPI